MKKYVKPLMESETFIANEYIGACWNVTCTSGQSVVVQGKEGQTFQQALYYHNGLDYIGKDTSNSDYPYILTGQIGECDGKHVNGNCGHTKVYVDLECNQWGNGDWAAVGFCRVVATPFVQGLYDLFLQDKEAMHHHAKVTNHSRSNHS